MPSILPSLFLSLQFKWPNHSPYYRLQQAKARPPTWALSGRGGTKSYLPETTGPSEGALIVLSPGGAGSQKTMAYGANVEPKSASTPSTWTLRRRGWRRVKAGKAMSRSWGCGSARASHPRDRLQIVENVPTVGCSLHSPGFGPPLDISDACTHNRNCQEGGCFFLGLLSLGPLVPML